MENITNQYLLDFYFGTYNINKILDIHQIPGILNKNAQTQSSTLKVQINEDWIGRSLITDYKNKETHENFLFLEYSSSEVANSKQVYIYIVDDFIHSNYKFLLGLPGLFLAVWIVQSLHKSEIIQSFFTNYNINPIIIYLILFSILIYISYAIRIQYEKKGNNTLESLEFEKKYDIRSNDTIFIRQIFDPSSTAEFQKLVTNTAFQNNVEFYIDGFHNRFIIKFDLLKKGNKFGISDNELEILLREGYNIFIRSQIHKKFQLYLQS